MDEEGFNKSLSSYYSEYKERLITEAADDMIKNDRDLEQLIADLASDSTFTGPIYDEYGRLIDPSRERYYKGKLEEYFRLKGIEIPYPDPGERDLFVNALVLNIYVKVSEPRKKKKKKGNTMFNNIDFNNLFDNSEALF